MNSVQLIGNLTRDPEKRELPSGTSVATLRIAVNGRRKNADDGYDEIAHYFDVVVYGKLADTCDEFLEKGRGVAVTGRLEHREWETDDGKRSTVEIVGSQIDFLPGRPAAPTGAMVADEPEPARA